MTIKTGIDISKISRFFRKGYKPDDPLVKRAFTAGEREKASELKTEAAFRSYYATRFAGKEAVFKAISEALAEAAKRSGSFPGFIPADIEILGGALERPVVKLHGKTAEALSTIDIQIDVSLSNEDDYAVASAIALY
ncbi:MAG: holo-ACP synthase [Spirochaetaceae bacterium]|jgi:phosphopantetheine--protein transferase-like protein|nr:holo-ACP synthase [Spirochaetaceae bacterium]